MTIAKIQKSKTDSMKCWFFFACARSRGWSMMSCHLTRNKVQDPSLIDQVQKHSETALGTLIFLGIKSSFPVKVHSVSGRTPAICKTYVVQKPKANCKSLLFRDLRFAWNEGFCVMVSFEYIVQDRWHKQKNWSCWSGLASITDLAAANMVLFFLLPQNYYRFQFTLPSLLH